MKKPYIDQEDRFLIKLNTTQGAFRMLNFRFMQFGKSLGINGRIIKIGYIIAILGITAITVQLLYQIHNSF